MPVIFRNIEATELHSRRKLAILSNSIDSVDIRTPARMSQDDGNRSVP